MNLEERIERRRRRGDSDQRLVRDFEALSPVSHLSEPNGRGPVLERLLDVLDPTFDGDLPGDSYVWGPKGSGKSAVVNALFEHLSEETRQTRSIIYTTTRAVAPPRTEFVYVDARYAASEFALYHHVLDAIVDESVPEGGIGTAALRERLVQELTGNVQAVVAVDHLGEPETFDASALEELLDLSSVAYLAVGRRPPSEVSADVTATVEVPRYEQHALVDLLTRRTSLGITRGALGHASVREVAEWADGDAHDALAAVFGAVDHAIEKRRDRVTTADIEAGMNDVPWQSVSLGRVFALPANRQRVLAQLLSLSADETESVTAATTAIANSAGIDLSPTTVKRVLYELAETGIVDRVENEDEGVKRVGRPPSRIEPRFPMRVFARLVDAQGV